MQWASPGKDLFVARYDQKKQAWAAPQKVGSGDSLRLAVNRAGEALLAWHHTTTLYTSIFASWWRPASGSWLAPQLLKKYTHIAGPTEIGLGASGQALAAWMKPYTTQSEDLQASHCAKPGGSWSTPYWMGGTHHKLQGHGVAVGAAGDKYLLWNINASGKTSTHVRWYKAASSSWTPEVLLVQDSDNDTRPLISTDGSGAAVVVWHWKKAPQNKLNYATLKLSDGSWTAGNLAGNPGYPSLPQLSLPGVANVHAIWAYKLGNDYELRAASYSASSAAWSKTLTLAKKVWVFSYPDIAADRQGNAWAVWQHYNYTSFKVYASMLQASVGAWGTAVELDDCPISSLWEPTPRVAVGNDGVAFAVWKCSKKGSDMVIRARRFGK